MHKSLVFRTDSHGAGSGGTVLLIRVQFERQTSIKGLTL